jgi:sugar transferase (PEP-CTERM/EpsH1 system associated)
MRILFVTPYVPSLIRVRPFNFIRQLSRHHSITLVSLAQGDRAEDDALVEMRRYCEGVHVLPLSRAGSMMSCCRRLLTPMPLQAAYTCASDLRDVVSRLAEPGRFDVLHVEHIRGAHLADGALRIPRVFDSVDCITRLLKLRLGCRMGVVQRVLGLEELLKMRLYEPRVASTFNRVVVTSRRDKMALEALIRRLVGLANNGPMHLDVVRNGVDCDYFRPMPVEPRSDSIVFAGRMSYFPNVSAALRFSEEVLPRIRLSHPGVRFRIVGSDPSEAVRRLGREPGVEVTGYVPDMRPYLASARVVVCPLSVGVGVQNKVLEAMAMAKPVVATSVACKGIPGAVHGTHLFRVDDPGEMAHAVSDLLGSPNRGSRIGIQARRFVEDGYSWEAATGELEQVYMQAMDVLRHSVPVAA